MEELYVMQVLTMQTIQICGIFYMAVTTVQLLGKVVRYMIIQINKDLQ